MLAPASAYDDALPQAVLNSVETEFLCIGQVSWAQKVFVASASTVQSTLT